MRFKTGETDLRALPVCDCVPKPSAIVHSNHQQKAGVGLELTAKGTVNSEDYPAKISDIGERKQENCLGL